MLDPQKNSFLIFGEDLFRAKKDIKEYLEKLLGSDYRHSFGFHSFDKDNFNIDDIFQAFQSNSLLSSQSVVLIQNSIADNLWKDQEEMLTSFLEKIASDHYIIFWEKKGIDRRRKVYKIISPNVAEKKEYEVLAGKELIAWLKKYFEKNYDGKISNSVLEKLVFLLGKNLYRLTSTLEMLFLSQERTSDQKVYEIKEADLDFLPHLAKEENIFKLVDSLGNKDYQSALSFLNQMVESKHELIPVIGMITRQLRLQMLYLSGVSNRMSPGAIRKEMRVPQFVYYKIKNQAQKFSEEKLKSLYEQFKKLDLFIKSRSSDPFFLLDMIVLSMCSG